ncbi:hypothetical protein AB0M54_07095 [Actinoplanes sp. NPDC051470]|uniref:hypothetical protein n=1 Tax=unclassified Actinoplanes TaxID=2626549 RepID=UPI003445EB75
MRIRRAAWGAALTLTMVAAGCGSGRDAASEKACNDVQALLGAYDAQKDTVVEIRAVLLGAIEKKFREVAAPATGDVKTSIVGLADTIQQANLTSDNSVTTLTPKFQEFEPKFATAREDVAAACA